MSLPWLGGPAPVLARGWVTVAEVRSQNFTPDRVWGDPGGAPLLRCPGSREIRQAGGVGRCRCLRAGLQPGTSHPCDVSAVFLPIAVIPDLGPELPAGRRRRAGGYPEGPRPLGPVFRSEGFPRSIWQGAGGCQDRRVRPGARLASRGPPGAMGSSGDGAPPKILGWTLAGRQQALAGPAALCDKARFGWRVRAFIGVGACGPRMHTAPLGWNQVPPGQTRAALRAGLGRRPRPVPRPCRGPRRTPAGWPHVRVAVCPPKIRSQPHAGPGG